ncbi:MAG: peptidase M64 [Prevotella sp.]|nr:peptidase M64 [Prevotella sp.]
MRNFLLTIACGLAMMLQAQDFDTYFTDNTLRIDYIFSGNSKEQHIAVDQLNMSPRWYGRRHRLSELPLEGNGQLTVRHHATGQVIYRHSFSTLFQEWLAQDESKSLTRAFENVFLVPMPRDTVDVTVDLRDNRRQIMTSLTHTVVPSDVLIRHIGQHPTPYVTVQQAADTTHCIRVAFVAEGYQQNEMDTYMKDVDVAMKALFDHEPFRSLRDRFHIVAVQSPSTDSGTSSPARGEWKRTALGSHFDTFYMDRYLTTLHLKTLHDWLAGIPYEHIIVLVNTEEYGGGGILNSYNLSMTHHPYYPQVVVHEFGHSFGGLGDEYAYEHEAIPMYPHDVEPWEPNLTTLHDFHGKWEDMIKNGTPIPTPESKNQKTIESRVGVFEGAGYSLEGVYRPAQDCRMRTNSNPIFCPVCNRALTRLIDFYTKP